MWLLEVAQAATGTPVDAILGNFKVFTGAVAGVMVGGALTYKGVRHSLDEGGGHLTAASLTQIAPGVALAGGGFLLGYYLMGNGAGMPLGQVAMGLREAIGDLLSIGLNPLGIWPAYFTYLSWRRRRG
jgi:hypothetical protein